MFLHPTCSLELSCGCGAAFFPLSTCSLPVLSLFFFPFPALLRLWTPSSFPYLVFSSCSVDSSSAATLASLQQTRARSLASQWTRFLHFPQSHRRCLSPGTAMVLLCALASAARCARTRSLLPLARPAFPPATPLSSSSLRFVARRNMATEARVAARKSRRAAIGAGDVMPEPKTIMEVLSYSSLHLIRILSQLHAHTHNSLTQTSSSQPTHISALPHAHTQATWARYMPSPQQNRTTLG